MVALAKMLPSLEFAESVERYTYRNRNADQDQEGVDLDYCGYDPCGCP